MAHTFVVSRTRTPRHLSADTVAFAASELPVAEPGSRNAAVGGCGSGGVLPFHWLRNSCPHMDPPPPPLQPPPQPRDPHGEGHGGGEMPYQDADHRLRALAGRAEGFGRHAIGGLHGAIYHVTSLEDDGHGSLREACRAAEPLWVVFEVSGTIHLQSYLRVASYKTIDGRGQRVVLAGKGLQLKSCHHVIVCNLLFEGGRGHDVDGIQIKPGSTDIWIDRCTLADYDDGLIDITRQSTDITVSRCHFARHDKTMLIGADPTHVDDRCIRVTIHHCFFDGTRQRHPRLRFGKVHLYNNYTRGWGIYAVCASVEAQIVSQCNIYEAGVGPPKKTTVFKYMPEKAADREDVVAGLIRSEGDAFLNGALPCLVDGPGAHEAVFRPEDYYQHWTMEPASPALKDIIQLCAGWQPVPRPPDHC